MGRLRRHLLTGSALTSTVARWMQPGIVKSVQRGTITLATVSSNTATITAVDVKNTRLIWLGTTSDDSGGSFWGDRSVRIALTNGTTITATAGSAGFTQVVSYEVIEYYPGVIKSVQRSTVQTSGAATVTTVNTLKSSLEWLGASGSGSSADNKQAVDIVLTNATTVTATSGTASALTISFQLVEYF